MFTGSRTLLIDTSARFVPDGNFQLGGSRGRIEPLGRALCKEPDPEGAQILGRVVWVSRQRRLQKKWLGLDSTASIDRERSEGDLTSRRPGRSVHLPRERGKRNRSFVDVQIRCVLGLSVVPPVELPGSTR